MDVVVKDLVHLEEIVIVVMLGVIGGVMTKVIPVLTFIVI